ncbi:MAG: type II secretion system protein [Phycisphaerae bacterium]|nr:type II secretion system protein [Phycisphaerae bacterium]
MRTSSSIRRRWHANSKSARPAPRYTTAFTLIEVLVVVAIIALLVSILLPSLQAARGYAKEVVCGSQERIWGVGLGNYSYVSKDWIPGVNTSGVALRRLQHSPADAFREGILPVQSFDWMTPLLDSQELPSRRADRFAFLLDQYKCPALLDLPSILYGSAPDKDDFEEIEHWSPVSYLMPAFFQYWGEKEKNKELARNARLAALKVLSLVPPEPTQDNVEMPTYVSKLNRIGTPAGKVFIAEGTRYLDDKGALDFDFNPLPNFFGAFTSGGAWWAGETAYGVKAQTPNWDGVPTAVEPPAKGKNLFLSYRHRVTRAGNGSAQDNKGMLNMLFYDGHVELLNDPDSRRIDYWYPKGCIVRNGTSGQGLTEVENGTVIP